MDEWKRFANAAVQEELIAKTEALRVKFGFDQDAEEPKDEDLEKLARELHDIQERWKTVADAPRAQAQALWHRYRQAADPMQARVREFFAHRNEERKAEPRTQDRADRTRRSARRLHRLDQDRRGVEEAAGRVAGRSAPCHGRTRRPPGSASARRATVLHPAQRRSRRAQGNVVGEPRAEGSAVRAGRRAGASTEWDKAAAEIRRLQADWKTIGPVRRNKSEAIWQRFRAACDTVLRTLQASRRDRARIQAGRSRRAPGGARSAAQSPRRTVARQLCPAAPRTARTRPLAPQPLEPVDAGRPPRRRSAERALHDGARKR